MAEEFDYSTLPEGERAKLFKCLEVLSNEVYQTPAFLLRALGRAGLLISPHPGPKLVARLEAAEAMRQAMKAVIVFALNSDVNPHQCVAAVNKAREAIAAWDEAAR